MKGSWITYLPEELAWLEARKDMPRRDLHAMFTARWDRRDVSLANLSALCKRKGWRTGRTGQFVRGQGAHNKGQKMSEEVRAKVARTMFKKGNLPHNTKFLGHERVSKNGYVEVSIAETNPHTGYERRYVLKHVHEWEKQHGPVPAGMCLKSVDGDRTNCDPANWQLIPRALLPSLNGGPWRGLPYDQAAQEVKPTIMLLAKLRWAKRVAGKGDKA